ncbi:sialidase family protein [Streptomyces halobius]|uniref:exo-alpha-sialidase n=1 Tax=Streptomyces halobius TaxID=2879846 RepID=A0ABY4MHN0_9ACTN|nr:sialidase family protein [Streptomyces halobius]UQA96752.1 glycoside hydrolase [Streptomyces halobius]
MNPVHPLALAALLVASGASLPAAPAVEPRAAHPLFESRALALSGQGAHTYRIPALTTLPDGALLAAYDRRNDSAADLPGDVDVMVRRSTDNGRTWSAPRAVVDYDGGAGAGDPSLVVDRGTGRVFLFHAYAPNGIGFANAGAGNAHDSTSILHTDYSYSDDGGRSWRNRRITKDLKDPSWHGIFASSGTGIQLSTGRLLQQYAFRKADGSMWAASAYSDDHGESWRLGEPVGPLMDENKTVELADGRVMLNSRTSSTKKRLVAFSRDGGLSYGTPVADGTLIDPVNNAAILRYDPTARPDRARAHWLLFSNTASTTARENLTVRLSCDDGRSWPVSRVVAPGPSAYSTLTRLKDGTFGLLYESGPYKKITFVRFDGEWLGAMRCPVAPSSPR